MAIADPDFVLQLAKTVADIYGEGTSHLLQIVAKRLAQGIDSPGWAERKLLELARLRNESQAVIDRLTDLGPEAAREALATAVDTGTHTAAIEVRQGFIKTNEAAVNAIARATVAPTANDIASVLGQMHVQILRSTTDIYRSVIAETSAGVTTGAQTRIEVAQRALNRFAEHGITGFVDNSGRNWEVQSYVEMATRTASSRAMVQGRLDVYQASGRRFVIVSDSPQECRLCRPWEGKVLAVAPGDVGSDPGDGRKVVASVADATSKGLFHANCRHDLRPYIPGLTPRTPHTADVAGDEARQTQRRLERGVRQWKRVQSAAMSPDAADRAAAHVDQWQGALKTHLAEHPNLTAKPNRTSLTAAR